ncbi:MAG TPA: HNH endonuclease [Blastocatellia bacterium]|nr:HNH endonuclease [Blastocatellia bacterium]
MKIALLLLITCLSDAALAQRNSSNLPDPTLTPGATLKVTRQELCGPEYRSPARNIPIALKGRIFDRYGMDPRSVGYNVDHLIPVRLGGSNSLNNLWPQPLSGEWNYHMKNRLERRLYKMVCSQTIALETAQQELARDWVSAYKKYITNSRPGPSRSPAQEPR